MNKTENNIRKTSFKKAGQALIDTIQEAEKVDLQKNRTISGRSKKQISETTQTEKTMALCGFRCRFGIDNNLIDQLSIFS
ncbi:hypothetical protein NXY11_19160 [Parabacteroides faecis]|uniref:hypothetical protein n=1 Tax=Parabacteroides faecis TaxID=1217282 RepID=UPI002164A9A6|nr:hypothetical protein [Parabacteroides faecis]MCS2891075.1 hypothetical protein [Parabacteroides faecis]UVQ45275.1 hypothetical protein NXY11_19160 [Parabacteroides faecis]